MPDSPSSLPAIPSLEQLKKRAKDLLKAHRAGDPAAKDRFRAVSQGRPAAGSRVMPEEPQLADAQFVLAREHGFDSWAKLKRHLEAIHPPGIEIYEGLAGELAVAYSQGNAMAVREINSLHGTSFVCDFHEPLEAQRRLPNWFASEARTDDLALADARQIVAQFYGFENWQKFTARLHEPLREARSASIFLSPIPPFYRIHWRENLLSVRGIPTDEDWDTIAGILAEHKLTHLQAAGITDAGMARIAKLGHLTHLQFGDAPRLTDAGVQHLARMSQILELEIGGWHSPITDGGLAALGYLAQLRRLQICWTRGITDVGVTALAHLHHLESVNFMGTPTGDGLLRALRGKPSLRHVKSGNQLTDAGLSALHDFPAFKAWQGGDRVYSLMEFDAEPSSLLLRGEITDSGMSALTGLDGLFALNVDDAKMAITSAGLKALATLPHLGFLGFDATDETMGAIAALPQLRMLMCQDTQAGNDGFVALSQSQTIEYIWGRRCYNLGGAGFAALARMPSLLGLSVSCKNVEEQALATLPAFPSLLHFMPMDFADDAFRYVGQCKQLEKIWCMYCRDTGDAATEHLARLAKLKLYYAGMTQITDHSLEILSQLHALERLDFWACTNITDAGVARLAALPHLQELNLDGLPNVSSKVLDAFPDHVRVNHSG